MSVKAKAFLSFILIEFLNRGKLTLRKIIKSNIQIVKGEILKQKSIQRPDMGIPSFINSPNGIIVSLDNIEFLRVLKVLSIIWGSVETFIEDLNDARNNNYSIKFSDFQNELSFIAFAYHFSSKYATDELFFSRKHISTYGHVKQYSCLNPVTTFQSLSYEFILPWNNDNIYTGQRCYFDKVDIRVINYSGSNLQGVSARTLDSINVSTEFIFQPLRDSINLLKQHKLLLHYGI